MRIISFIFYFTKTLLHNYQSFFADSQDQHLIIH